MAERWPWLDEWRRNLTDVLSLSSAAAASLGLPQPGLLIGDPFTMIVDAARNWLIGKRRTFTFAGHEPTLVLEDLSVEGSDLAKAVGQIRTLLHPGPGRRMVRLPVRVGGGAGPERAPAARYQAGAGGRAGPL